MTAPSPAPADTRLAPASRLLWGWAAREGIAAARTGQPFAFARGSAASLLDSTGAVGPIGSHVPAASIRGGVSVLDLMPGRTNHLLQSRDLSQAAWVKTTLTAVRDLVGGDGQPDSGTRLTATAAVGTILQQLTLAAADVVASVWLRRVSGAGTVDLTLDGGTTWTPVTVTGIWTRFLVPWQNRANPQVGIRITGNGTVIGADWAQCETGRISTAPILTAGAAAARTGDALTSSVGQRLPREGTLHVRVAREPWMDLAGDLAGDRYLLSIGTVQPRLEWVLSGPSRLLTARLFDGVGTPTVTLAIPTGTLVDAVLRWRNADTGIELQLESPDAISAWSAPAAPVSAWGDSVLALGDSATAPGQQLAAGLAQVGLASGLLSLSTITELL